MTQALVQVGVQIVAYIGIFLQKVEGGVVGVVDDKLLAESVAMRRLVVGAGKVTYGNALAAILLAHPVTVGQVDADGTAGVEVAAQNGSHDDLCRHASALLLLESWVDGRVVLEPLCVAAQCLSALRGVEVGEVGVSLPRSLQPEWVAVHLGESVGEVHAVACILHPLDGVLVERIEVAGAIEVDECSDYVSLLFALGKWESQFEVLDDMADGVAVESTLLPYEFEELSVVLLHQTAVHAVHYGT